MARTEITLALDRRLAEHAGDLGTDVSAAARAGVRAAIRGAMVEADRAGYERLPEELDAFWDEAQAWA